MKWKIGLISAVITVLVIAVVSLGMTLRDFASNSKGELDVKNRITQLKLVLEEQKLITEILTLKYEAAVIQAKFKPVPPPAPAQQVAVPNK